MGTAERRMREKEKRRSDIIDAAEKIFFLKGYEDSTVDDIAELAELSKGTIYVYFNSKEEILQEVVHRGHGVLMEVFKEAAGAHETGIDRVAAIGNAYTKFSREHSDYLEILLSYHGEYRMSVDEDNPLSVLVRAIKSGIDDGSIRSSLDPVKTGIILWGQTYGVIRLIHNMFSIFEEHYSLTPDELLHYHFQQVLVFLRGVSGDGGEDA